MANSPKGIVTIRCADLVAAGGEVGDWTVTLGFAVNPEGGGSRYFIRAIFTSVFYPGIIEYDQNSEL
jgi:hypothetical protein